MKYEAYITRNVKEFIQISVEAPTKELAETFATIKAQEANDNEWHPEMASMVVVEKLEKAA